MGTKQSPANLELSFGVVNCLEEFSTHFNPNNFFYITSDFNLVQV